MAFTDAELVRGAISTGVTFVLLAPVLMIVLTLATTHDPQSLGIAIYVILVATFVGVIPFTLLTVVVATPVARAIGRALRRERRRWPHLLAFAGLGAVTSVLVSTVAGLLMWTATAEQGGPIPLEFTLPFGLLLAPIAAASSAWGWWRTSRRALARDAAIEAQGEEEEA
jgi:hypothetical protein